MRNCKIDNIKGCLILLVIVGHFLELVMGKGIERDLYTIIYSFHMPLFVYTTGYFARFRVGRLVRGLCIPYILFQTIYILFARVILHKNIAIQYERPYWLLWYLFAVAVWSCLLLLVERRSFRWQIAVFCLVCLISLGCGFFKEFGRDFSLSRIIVYFPFFLLGYSMHTCREDWKEALKMGLRITGIDKTPELHWEGLRRFAKGAVAMTLVICIIQCIAGNSDMKLSWFYEAVSYAAAKSSVWFRAWHLAVAAVWIAAAELYVPNKEWKVIGYLGRHTMVLYLAHGFCIKWMDAYIF